ncbi:uncharacterized protein LOC134769817 isoform X2 [Penaeus indicus]
MESPFWEIVFTNDLNSINNFLRSKIKSIYEEIRRPAKSFYGKEPPRLRIPEPLCRAAANISARKMMMTWTERTEALFEAAEWGMYADEGGVHEAMATFGLPATVKDCHGWSVLHYAASMRFADDSPVWGLRDIRKYVEQHKPFPNAVDHWGQTALHVLAQHPRGSLEAVLGRKKRKHNVAGAWVAIACLLIKYGCDPKIQDKQGKRAEDRAREFNNVELAQLLEQECSSGGEMHHEAARKRFPDLLEASRRGNTKDLTELLLAQVPAPSTGVHGDPLLEAFRNGHRDAVLLLLSAGASLCDSSVSSFIDAEAAHREQGLSMLLAALIRRDRLDALAHASAPPRRAPRRWRRAGVGQNDSDNKSC